jgi:N-sulfoglucosamine sulfohydrolase
MKNRMNWMTAAFLAPLAAIPAAGQITQKPNIVLFLSDDHGWRDSGCYGNNDVRTPNIDRLAKEGMRFTHAYVALPQSAPTVG